MNSSGIFSLAGFAYQIKVFIYYLATLEDGYTIGYETYDDVALKKSDTETNKQEDKLNTYNGLLNSSSGITALQIKHTTLTSEDYEKVLFNWILLKNEFSDIDNLQIFIFDDKDSKTLYCLITKKTCLTTKKLGSIPFLNRTLNSKKEQAGQG